MKQFTTRAIVLRRIDYGESDRIVTVLTPGEGKLTALAKGVRKVASKLAGGIELFTVNEVAIISGKSELKTLRSSRMEQHFSHTMKDFQRLQLGYEVLKAVDKQTEEVVEEGYYTLLAETLQELDDTTVTPTVIQLWFHLRLLQLHGRQPDLKHDTNGERLNAVRMYGFSAEDGGLYLSKYGQLGADHIKFARLCLRLSPQKLMNIQGSAGLAKAWLGQLPPIAEA